MTAMVFKLHASALSVAVVLSAALAPAAQASSDDAWVQFRKDVTAKCLKAAVVSVAKPTIVVDPFGSESFGLAIVTGKSGGFKVSYICVFDKKTGATELGGELEVNVVKRAGH